MKYYEIEFPKQVIRKKNNKLSNLSIEVNK